MSTAAEDDDAGPRPERLVRGAGVDRSPKGEERRAAMLQAVGRLVRERPLAEIGVGDIALAARVSRPAFYFYFPNKGAAVAELLWDVFEEMVRGASGFLDEVPDARRAVRASLDRTLELWDEHRPLLLAMADAVPVEPGVRELWDGWIEAFAGRIAVSIDRQRAAGLAPDQGPAMPLARILIAANERVLQTLARAEAGPAERAEALDALETVWLAVIYGTTN